MLESDARLSASESAVVLHTFLVTFQRSHDTFHHLIRDTYVLENRPESLRNLLFGKPGGVAFPAIAAATVIDVFPLFLLGRDRALIVSTRQQSAKRDFMFLILSLVALVKNVLYALE